MKKTFTLEEVRCIAAGSYCQGYLDAYDPDDETDINDDIQLDFLIGKYCDARSENERRICVLS